MVFIRWLGHSSFEVVINGRIVLFDPWLDPRPTKVRRLVPPAVTEEKIRKCDIIFLSHEHFDHCSPYDVNSIVQRTYASVVAPEETLALLNIPARSRVSVNAGEAFTILGLDVEVVEAKHPQSTNPVGFVLGGEGKKIYFAGDTYDYWGMSNLDVDVALLPIGGSVCMDSIGAVKAVKMMKAKYTVPMTYGTFSPLAPDAGDFVNRVKAIGKTQVVPLGLGEGFDI